MLEGDGMISDGVPLPQGRRIVRAGRASTAVSVL